MTRPKRWGGSRIACNIFFVWEALRPFLRGATCVVIPDDVIFDPPQLLKALEENRVTEWLSTPSLFESVIQVAPEDALSAALRTLRVLFFNGEGTALLPSRCLRLCSQLGHSHLCTHTIVLHVHAPSLLFFSGLSSVVLTATSGAPCVGKEDLGGDPSRRQRESASL